ncbi:hypothetical protein CLOM_g23376 [Closterium sp. NIES-68]|nr:hypothetical protein CLOM_g23376 [Closterium sp. NIES-68]GJP71604.1 hypothetical protein CLOP_g2421 [Closterium sp. NIES-67]
MGGCFSSELAAPLHPERDSGGSSRGTKASTRGTGQSRAAARRGSAFSRSSTRKSAPRVPENLLGQPFRAVEDDYEIGKELGRGLYGITYMARHRQSEELYACKTITKRHLSPTSCVNVAREATILARLSTGHAGIASLIDQYEDATCVHFILQICTGGMLYDGVKAEGSYSERRAAGMVRQIVQAVQYMHGHGVVHRDLKLENFLLLHGGEDAPLMAIDFGLSTFFEPGQRFTELVGSAYYVAPEVLRKDYGSECDVWSIGVITYMLLCGTPPFWDVSEEGICEAVLRGQYEMSCDPWPSISPQAKHLVGRMLESDPSKRITTQEILDHEWVREGGAPSCPLSPPVMKRVRQFCQMNHLKRRALAVVAGCCLDEREMAVIRTRFDHLDLDKDGRISVGDLIAGFQQLHIPLAEEEAREIIEAADSKGSGTLDLSEYASAIMVKRLDAARIERAFRHFDREGRGYITVDDLKATLAAGDSKETAERLWKEIGSKHSGHIDREEFSRMMREGVDGEGSAWRGGALLSDLSENKLGELYHCGRCQA